MGYVSTDLKTTGFILQAIRPYFQLQIYIYVCIHWFLLILSWHCFGSFVIKRKRTNIRESSLIIFEIYQREKNCLCGRNG